MSFGISAASHRLLFKGQGPHGADGCFVFVNVTFAICYTLVNTTRESVGFQKDGCSSGEAETEASVFRV